MYSPDGYVGWSARRAGRKKVSGSDGRTDLDGATPEERAEARAGMTCYAGHYELKDGEVHHHVEMALNPNLVGQTMIRRVHIDGPNLTLSSVPDTQDGNLSAHQLAGGAQGNGALQNKPAQVGVLGEIADVLLHIGGVDLHRLAGAVGGGERNLVEHALHHGLQPPRADVLDAGIDQHRDVGDGVDGVLGEFERHALGRHQRDVLLDQRGLGLGQDAPEVVAGQRA